MRVTRRTTARLWRGWWAALSLTLAYALTALAPTSHANARVGGRRVSQQVPAALPLPSSLSAPGSPALPVVPMLVPATIGFTDPGVIAARPFSLGGASALDRTRALRCLADAVYYEAASEPEAGQRAIAQVVLNRVRHPAFPATVCGVVYQGSAGHGCQFSFTCDGALARIPSAGGWARAARIAAAALAGRVEPSVGLATHYHTYAVAPAWNRGLVMTAAIGAHFFHRWAGAWGLPGAFGRRYAGGEPALPLPTPLAPAVLVAAATPLPDTAMAAAAPLPVARAVPPADDQLPPASAILPRWRDSGKPL